QDNTVLLSVLMSRDKLNNREHMIIPGIKSSSDTIVPSPTKGKRIKTSTKVDKLTKEKQPAKSSTAKGLNVLSESNDEDEGADDDDDQSNDDDQEDQDYDDQDEQNQDDLDKDDNEKTDSDNNGDDFVHPQFSTHDKEAKNEESFDPIVRTPSHDDKIDDEGNDEDSDGIYIEGDE
nr:hypothetical protein [Tanacetum cinerariifolium]